MSPFGSKSYFVFIVAVLVCALLGTAAGQSRQSGEIRGTVADQSQAVLTGVKVAITNVSTGVVQTVTTDASGVYDAPYVAPGQYSLTFSKDTFKTFVRDGIDLHVQTITINATLDVGMSSEKVTVTATQPDLETETTDKSTRFDSSLVADAPTGSRSWMDLLASLPGVNPGWGEGSSGQSIGVNGQSGFFSNWQIDGGIAMFGQSSNPDLLAPPIDSIEEVSANTSNFGAEHGSGFSVFNVITKSGTNSFHGSVYEYIQNDALNALNAFAQTKPPVRWNEYGFNVGGPLVKNKAFFFFGYQRNPSNSSYPAPTSYPTTGTQPNGGMGYREGDFSALLGTPVAGVVNPCDPQQVVLNGQIYDPATTRTVGGQVCRDPFPGNIIPQSRMDSVALNVQKNFPKPNRAGLFNNYYTNLPSPNTNTWFNGKVDYDVTPKNRVTGSTLVVKFNSPLEDQNCAINCGAWSGTETQAQLTDVWTLSPKMVSEFRFSLSRAKGIASVVNQGQGWPAKLGLLGSPDNLFPSMSMEGALNTSIGYTPFPPAIDAETTFVPSEVVTWVKGKHILKFGGEFDRWWVNTGWGTATAGAFDFSGVFTQNPYDQSLSTVPQEGEGYADFLLGAPSSWSVSINPETGGRMYSAQAFVQDEYKLKPNLTVTAGVRYVLQSGWDEIHNKLSTFQPNIVNPADGSLGAMWYAGQQGHRALTKTIPNFFSPRLGFAWAPGKNWSVRGGFGIYNIIAGQNITAPAQAWGQGWSPAGSLYDTTNPVFQLSAGPPAGSVIYPTNANRTPDLLNGSDVNYSFYNSPMEYTIQDHLDVQHEFQGGFVLDVGYVGNKGVNLQFTRDLNQVPLSKLGSGQRPYSNYNQINAAYFDGWSNYNALQVTVKKQFSRGLLFQVNYSWAKAMDTITNAGWGGGAGSGDRVGYQNANDLRANYGRAATDIRNMINGNIVYHLPFGRGKAWLNQGGVLNEIVGGWELSSIFQVRSGLPFSPLMGYNNSGALSGTWRPNQLPAGTACDPTGTLNKCLNGGVFATPQQNTFGNAGRDILTGPNWRTVDLALLKDFSLSRLHEGMNLQFKAQATDVFNHPNLGFPVSNYVSSGFGQITYANTSRQMQLGLKISF